MSETRPRRAGLGLGAVVLSVSLLGCGRPASTARPPAALELSPVATSFTSAGTTYLIVPMGLLNRPLQRFWELFAKRAGEGSFVLDTPPGVGDNGGLVAAAPAGGTTVLVGFLASNLLGFSPLAATDDRGESWSAAVLPAALDPVPSPLAESSGGALALLGNKDTTLVASKGGLSGWQRIVRKSVLSKSAAAKSCGIEALTALARLPGNKSGGALLGAACHRGERAGIFEESRGSWQEIGPELGRSGPSEVVDLLSAPGGLTALVSFEKRGSLELEAAVETRGAGRWRSSGQLRLPLGEQVRGVGLLPAGGLFVVLAGRLGSPRLELWGSTGPGWRSRFLPAGTETVIEKGGSPARAGLEAVAVGRSVLSIYRLEGGRRAVRVEQEHLHIPYGSAS